MLAKPIQARATSAWWKDPWPALEGADEIDGVGEPFRGRAEEVRPRIARPHGTAWRRERAGHARARWRCGRETFMRAIARRRSSRWMTMATSWGKGPPTCDGRTFLRSGRSTRNASSSRDRQTSVFETVENRDPKAIPPRNGFRSSPRRRMPTREDRFDAVGVSRTSARFVRRRGRPHRVDTRALTVRRSLGRRKEEERVTFGVKADNVHAARGATRRNVRRSGKRTTRPR